jgi:hypothetical protein
MMSYVTSENVPITDTNGKKRKFVSKICSLKYTYKSVVMYIAFYYKRHYNGVL